VNDVITMVRLVAMMDPEVSWVSRWQRIGIVKHF
jgi:hypothetical protein